MEYRTYTVHEKMNSCVVDYRVVMNAAAKPLDLKLGVKTVGEFSEEGSAAVQTRKCRLKKNLGTVT